MEQLLTIDILGQPYTFKADKDFDRAKEIADFFAKEVQRVESELQTPSPGMNKTAILILAALNIANENYELKRNQAVFKQTVINRADSMLELLNGRNHDS